MTGKRIEEESADMDTMVISIGKFKEECFEAAEDFFHNLLSQKTGKSKAKIRYVTHDRVVPEVFPDVST